MKIRKDIIQGTEEWLALRLGVITASDVKRVITEKKLVPGSAQAKYRAELTAEIILGQPVDDAEGKWLERGSMLEREALLSVSLHLGSEIETVGFIASDDGDFGCSPDGIITNGHDSPCGVELKCPSKVRHFEYLLDEDQLIDDYRLQVQYSLWVTGWDKWYLCSYLPSLPMPIVIPIDPDPDVHDAFNRYVPEFRDTVADAVDVANKKLGLGAEIPAVATEFAKSSMHPGPDGEIAKEAKKTQAEKNAAAKERSAVDLLDIAEKDY